MVDLSAIITDDEDDSTIIQHHVDFLLIAGRHFIIEEEFLADETAPGCILFIYKYKLFILCCVSLFVYPIYILFIFLEK